MRRNHKNRPSNLKMWMLAGGVMFSGCQASLNSPGLRGEFSRAGAFVDFIGGALAVTREGVFLDFPDGFIEVSDDGVFVDAPGVDINIFDH